MSERTWSIGELVQKLAMDCNTTPETEIGVTPIPNDVDIEEFIKFDKAGTNHICMPVLFVKITGRCVQLFVYEDNMRSALNSIEEARDGVTQNYENN